MSIVCLVAVGGRTTGHRLLEQKQKNGSILTRIGHFATASARFASLFATCVPELTIGDDSGQMRPDGRQILPRIGQSVVKSTKVGMTFATLCPDTAEFGGNRSTLASCSPDVHRSVCSKSAVRIRRMRQQVDSRTGVMPLYWRDIAVDREKCTSKAKAVAEQETTKFGTLSVNLLGGRRS